MPHETSDQKIQEIRRWLEASHIEASWNERPAGSDVADYAGEIEIFLKRDGRLWIAGCRAHGGPQDADWIGELAGRRDKLNADAVLAISSAGFTEDAVHRARRYGVITRDLASLSAEEISGWGAMTPATLIFYEFRDMEVMVTLPGPIDTKDLIITNDKHQPIPARDVLMRFVRNYPKKLEESFVGLRGTLQGPILINGVAPRAISIEGRMRSRRYQTALPCVTIHGKPAPTGEAEEQAKLPSFIFDLSRIEIPERCIFGLLLLPAAEDGSAPPADIVGAENALQSKVHLKFVLQWKATAANQ